MSEQLAERLQGHEGPSLPSQHAGEEDAGGEEEVDPDLALAMALSLSSSSSPPQQQVEKEGGTEGGTEDTREEEEEGGDAALARKLDALEAQGGGGTGHAEDIGK